MIKSGFYKFMCWYDAYWRRKHKVEKVDELISLSFENFAGERCAMNDGSWIEPGDPLAILHFNRECFSDTGTTPRDYTRSALRFRKLLMASFKQLAARIDDDERLRHVKAFHGVSWLPSHGEKVGFMIERLPDSALNRIRKLYFRVLLNTFFPALAARSSTSIHPHAYWLTRTNLLKYFSSELSRNDLSAETNNISESRSSESDREQYGASTSASY